MSDRIQPNHLVAVIGAGPAGLFAACELADKGVQVALFNRDIKPGGLAEYGIYPEKRRLKEGLRCQFRQILARQNITYYGNVLVSCEGDLTLDDLRQLGFQALLVTVGAQGTKWLGLPGEDLTGVYHAKNLVYYYNALPPFSQQPYHIGKRVAIVGAGNVMMDIARYLIQVRKVDEVLAVVRRGPAEIKFDKHEVQTVGANLDQEALAAEINRAEELMRSLGQDPQSVKDFIHSAVGEAAACDSPTRLRLCFLLSPTQIVGDERGFVKGLEVEHNTLVLKNGEVKAQGLGTHEVLDVDTVVFAIGDRVDENLGLPVKSSEFVKNPTPRYAIEGVSYEAYDPDNNCPIEGVFVAGWARKASDGLVGIARKDGVRGVRSLMQYLEGVPPLAEPPLAQIAQRLDSLGKPVITKTDLERLEAAEQARAQQLGVAEFRFLSNSEMIDAIRSSAIEVDR